MDLFIKQSGPLTAVNLHQPWSQKFANYDDFLDNFSNLLIFHNDGYFLIWEEFQPSSQRQQQTSIPFTLNLATTQ